MSVKCGSFHQKSFCLELCQIMTNLIFCKKEVLHKAVPLDISIGLCLKDFESVGEVCTQSQQVFVAVVLYFMKAGQMYLT